MAPQVPRKKSMSAKEIVPCRGSRILEPSAVAIRTMVLHGVGAWASTSSSDVSLNDQKLPPGTQHTGVESGAESSGRPKEYVFGTNHWVTTSERDQPSRSPAAQIRGVVEFED